MAAEGEPKSRSKVPAMKRKSRNRIVVVVTVIIVGLLQFAFWGGYCPLSWKGLAKARESAKRATCKNNLMNMGLALHLYASAHDGKFPQGQSAAEVLSKLMQEGYLGAESGSSGVPLYVCPSAVADVEAWKEVRKPTEDTVSYEWVTGVDADSPADFVVMFDRSAEHRRWIPPGSVALPGEEHGNVGRNVLFVDGHVSWNPEETVQRRMAWQEEMMKRMEEGGKYVPFEEWRP